MSRDDNQVTISEVSVELGNKININNIDNNNVIKRDFKQMDLSTPRRPTDGVPDIQKTTSNHQQRVAKSVFSIRSLVDIGDVDLPNNIHQERSQNTGEFFFPSKIQFSD